MESSIRKKRLSFCMRMLYQQLPASIVVAISMGISDMADALVLGNRIGEVGLAAIALATPVYMIMNIIIQGFGPGGSIRYATLMAEGNEEDAGIYYRSAIKYSVISGLAIAVFVNLFMSVVLGIQGTTREYADLYAAASLYLRIVSCGAPVIITSFVLNDFMRNEDLEQIAGIGASVGNALDVVLNIVLVLFLHMGIAGSGIATVTGKSVSLIIYLVALYIKKSNLRILKGKTAISVIPRCFKTGASTAIQYFSDMLFFLGVNNVLMRMAGQSGVAVFDLVQNVSYLLMYLYLAFAEAGQPAVSTYTGEKNMDARGFLKKRMLLLGEVSIGIIAILIFIFAGLFCRMFGVSESETVTLGVHAIRIYILGAPFMGAALILGSYFQACDNAKASYLIATLRGIIILFPVTFIMSFTGIEYFFLLYPITEILSLVVFSAFAKSKKFESLEIDEERVCRYLIENDTKQLTECCVKVEAFCERWEVNPKKQYMVKMALEELVGAIMQHGFKDEEGLCEVTIVMSEDKSFSLHIRDNAITFNPFDMQRKNNDELDEEEINLLCIDVIKMKAQSFFYRRYHGFNTLVVKL